MEPETWKQAEDLFGRGLEAPAAEQDHLLAQVQPEVAAMVRDLWRRHAEAGSFLDRPLVEPACPCQFADGQILGGRFKIAGLIGAGGMGEVYRAHDDRLGRVVAVKALRADLTVNAESRSRFEREARAVCSLNHPHICSLYDLGWDGTVPFLVMEHLSGETLAERLSRGQLPLEELVAVGKRIADALSYAHQHGVVHRDLKPGNIMLTEHGPKLLDFGIAKQVMAEGVRSDTVTQTAAGAIVGSAAYMSPEQAQGRPTDHRSDVFSFGAVLYEMATGRRAFQGDTNISTLAAVLEREPVPLRTLAPASPPALDVIVRRCLRKNAAERYPDMAAVGAALQGLMKHSARWRWAAAAAAVMAVASIAAATAWRGRATDVPVDLPKPVQLTADPGNSQDPSLSPDGKWLVYASDRGGPGNRGLWIQRLDGAESRKLTDCAHLGDPVFTPDGQRIVYSCGENRKNQNLYSVGLSGGDSTLVARDAQWPSISPDGKYVRVHVAGNVQLCRSATRRRQAHRPSARRLFWLGKSTLVARQPAVIDLRHFRPPVLDRATGRPRRRKDASVRPAARSRP
jgi:serine/threonine protein kinase